MVLRGFSQKALRWPILIVVFTIMGFEFLLYLCVRLCVNLYEMSSRFRHRAQKQALDRAEDFVTWCAAARELDRLEGREKWKREDESPFYDYQLIREHIANLARLREERNLDGLMSHLKLILCTYNVGGINNSHLYQETHFGTKVLVHDFLQALHEAAIIIRDAEEIPLQQRRDFFRRARRWYGRTALLLSGGAAMGYFHIGTLKCLIEAKCLPQIISGASAGSLMASFIAVRTDQEVLQELCVPESERFFRACEEPTLVKLTRWLKKGYAFDKDIWREHMRRDITKGDTTFLEAYEKFGRIINIATTATSKYAPTLILNYRSTPDVVIWSAVLASSAFPNFLSPVELQLKNPRTGELEPFHVHGHTFTDGTIKNDIPIKALAKMWNTNYNIVSQVNPHLIPLFFGQRGGSGRPAPSVHSSSSSAMRGGFVLAMFEKLLKLELKKWFKLIADLDLLPVIFGTDWRFIYLQKLTGTVTIVPAAPLWSYFRVISDPDRETMKEYIRHGEKATWYKLCRISNHYRIEKLLMECTRVLEKEAMKAGLPTQKERVSHVNAGVVPDRGSSSARNGTVAAPSATNVVNSTSSSNGTSASTAAKPSNGSTSHHHPKPHHTAAAKKIHANFTNQDSSHEHQAAAQRAYFHLNPSTASATAGAGAETRERGSRSPSISPNLRPQRASSGDDAEVDPVEVEEAFLAPDVEIDHSVTADLLTTMGDADWRRGDDETDQTDEEYEQSPTR